jgi:hypothetical protein
MAKAQRKSQKILVASVLSGLVIIATGLMLLSGRATNLSADLNNSGKVDVFDLSILLSKWGTNTSTHDLNSDSIVNIFDLSILLGQWGGSGIANTCPAYPATPDASCTGPTSSNLPLWTGGDEFRTDGQVVENVEIRTGGLYVPANNVTFRNVKIVYTGALEESFTMVNLNYNTGTVFENCELDGQGKVARGITGSGVTVRGCEIYGVGNAVETDTPLVVENNYFHHICTADGTDWHSDGIQTPESADNVTVRHNTILLCGPETGAINIMGTPEDPATNVLIENNLFAGGGYTMYAGIGANYKVINNRFSTQVYPKVGYYNIWYWDPDQDGDVTRSGNVIHETNAPANDNL